MASSSPALLRPSAGDDEARRAQTLGDTIFGPANDALTCRQDQGSDLARWVVLLIKLTDSSDIYILSENQ